MIQRHLLAALQEILNKGKSVLLLGPRQTQEKPPYYKILRQIYVFL